MYRSLAARAVVPVAVAITGFVVICCVLLYAIIKADMIEGAFEQEASLAATVIKSAHYTMLKADREGLKNIIANVGGGQGVEHLRILNTDGSIAFSSRKGETVLPPERGVTSAADRNSRLFKNDRGAQVLAIRVPIPNEPACSSAACHVHGKDLGSLGVLDIGLSTAKLQKDLALMRGRMILFCLMVLLLTIGGVAAILNRSVFAPLSRLTDFSDRLVSGTPPGELPRQAGEVGRLAANLRRAAEELARARAELAGPKGARAGEHGDDHR